jgi:acetyl-CoA carboxylase biotin carboxyl carrier protein
MTTESKKTNDHDTVIGDSGLSFCQIKELMTLMNKEGITRFQMGDGCGRIVIRRDKTKVFGVAEGCVQTVPLNPCRETENISEGLNATGKVRTGHVVTSPVVGVFYDTPAPDQPPYVSVGSTVGKGDVLCIIEAMKLMNEVTSPISGTITEILVEKANRVEFGQELFVIEPGE